MNKEELSIKITKAELELQDLINQQSNCKNYNCNWYSESETLNCSWSLNVSKCKNYIE